MPRTALCAEGSCFSCPGEVQVTQGIPSEGGRCARCDCECHWQDAMADADSAFMGGE